MSPTKFVILFLVLCLMYQGFNMFTAMREETQSLAPSDPTLDAADKAVLSKTQDVSGAESTTDSDVQTIDIRADKNQQDGAMDI